MNNFITKNEALEILQVSSYRQLKRIVDRCGIETKSLGIGKATLYNRTQVCKAVVQTDSTKKFAPKKPQVKAKEKKEEKIKVAAKKETAKKEIEKKTKNPLNETGQDEFIRVQGELKGLGIYEEKDRAILLSYCICYQNYMFYIDLSASLSHTTTDDNGNDKVNPYFTVADKLLSQMIKLSSILGIGKRSTIGLDIKPVAEESMISQLLKS